MGEYKWPQNVKWAKRINKFQNGLNSILFLKSVLYIILNFLFLCLFAAEYFARILGFLAFALSSVSLLGTNRQS